MFCDSRAGPRQATNCQRLRARGITSLRTPEHRWMGLRPLRARGSLEDGRHARARWSGVRLSRIRRERAELLRRITVFRTKVSCYVHTYTRTRVDGLVYA